MDKRTKYILENIAYSIHKHNGEAYYVGGYVRDKLLGIENKDIDIEIFGIRPNKLKSILSKFGTVDEVGKTFGIYRIHNLDVDFSLPRQETKVGELHTDFNVNVNPWLSTEIASKRRDFTINSIMQNVLTDKIIDHHNGINDLKNKVIRCVDRKTFIEDELRALRACQFSSRFNFSIDEETIELCKNFEFNLSRERIFEEMNKMLLKSQNPSIGLNYMMEMNIVEKLFPELYAMKNCIQSKEHHPEGDVWTHTMLVVDNAAKLREKTEFKLELMYSALLHDIGKPLVTKIDENGKITSYQHEKVGVNVAKNFLQRLTNGNKFTKLTLEIIKNHMKPNMIAFKSEKTMRRLMLPTDINLLLLLAEADFTGRNISNIEKEYENYKKWFKNKLIELANSENNKIVPIVFGRDLIKMGFIPSNKFKVILDYALELQIEGKNKEEILELIKNKY